ncbi:DUF1983 domain-containing protein [Escherichia coli]|nr:DUF1983 domain-containing protein [Escherichia coli]EFC6947539.1 DUF1983 domain-containing protein [Escherichia coli]
MANAWLRLWHDMPNDPKWRTIARVSGQPIATVMAVYIHLLVSASRNVTRGHIDVTTEDLASALDVTEEVIDSILQTMQGRVLDGDLITGWEKRQVLKEDNGNISQTAKSPAERKRAQRERERKREQNGDCHGASRNVTHMSRRVTTDKDTDKDTDQEDQNTMVHGVKNATNQAGDVQTVNPGQPAGTTPEADSAYALKADSGAVQQVMTPRPEQSHQLQQPEADSAIQRKADRVVPENTGLSVGRVDYPDAFEQVWREYPLRAGANPKKSAFSAWKARLREGVPPEAMLDGVRRYARYLAAIENTPDGMQSQVLLAADRIAMVNPANGNTKPMFVGQGDQIFMNDVFLKRLTAPTITSGGNPPAFSLTPDGRLTAKNADISGSVNANAGTLNNVTINENCRVLGKLSANQIEGDLVKTVGKAFPRDSRAPERWPSGTITVRVYDDQPFDRQIVIPAVAFRGAKHERENNDIYSSCRLIVKKNGAEIYNRTALDNTLVYTGVIDMPAGRGHMTLEFSVSAWLVNDWYPTASISDLLVVVMKKSTAGISIS